MRTEFPEVIDSTMRAAFVACPKKFWYEFVREIAPGETSVDLHAGACFARGIEVMRNAYYGSGAHPDEALALGAEALSRAWGTYDSGDHVKSLPRMLGALDAYCVEYPLATDFIRPVMLAGGKPATEFNFVLPLEGTRHPKTGQPILYSGRFDMLGVKDDVLFVDDEKTTKQLGPTWSQQWTLRSQFTGYVWGARQYGYAVAGAIIRGISILKQSYGHAQAIIYRDPWVIERWQEQLRRDISRMITSWETNTWDMSLDSACSNYGGCPFLRLCDTQNPEPYIDVYYRTRAWDPTKRPD